MEETKRPSHKRGREEDEAAAKSSTMRLGLDADEDDVVEPAAKRARTEKKEDAAASRRPVVVLLNGTTRVNVGGKSSLMERFEFFRAMLSGKFEESNEQACRCTATKDGAAAACTCAAIVLPVTIANLAAFPVDAGHLEYILQRWDGKSQFAHPEWRSTAAKGDRAAAVEPQSMAFRWACRCLGEFLGPIEPLIEYSHSELALKTADLYSEFDVLLMSRRYLDSGRSRPFEEKNKPMIVQIHLACMALAAAMPLIGEHTSSPIRFHRGMLSVSDLGRRHGVHAKTGFPNIDFSSVGGTTHPKLLPTRPSARVTYAALDKIRCGLASAETIRKRFSAWTGGLFDGDFPWQSTAIVIAGGSLARAVQQHVSDDPPEGMDVDVWCPSSRLRAFFEHLRKWCLVRGRRWSARVAGVASMDVWIQGVPLRLQICALADATLESRVSDAPHSQEFCYAPTRGSWDCFGWLPTILLQFHMTHLHAVFYDGEVYATPWALAAWASARTQYVNITIDRGLVIDKIAGALCRGFDVEVFPTLPNCHGSTTNYWTYSSPRAMRASSSPSHIVVAPESTGGVLAPTISLAQQCENKEKDDGDCDVTYPEVSVQDEKAFFQGLERVAVDPDTLTVYQSAVLDLLSMDAGDAKAASEAAEQRFDIVTPDLACKLGWLRPEGKSAERLDERFECLSKEDLMRRHTVQMANCRRTGDAQETEDEKNARIIAAHKAGVVCICIRFESKQTDGYSALARRFAAIVPDKWYAGPSDIYVTATEELWNSLGSSLATITDPKQKLLVRAQLRLATRGGEYCHDYLVPAHHTGIEVAARAIAIRGLWRLQDCLAMQPRSPGTPVAAQVRWIMKYRRVKCPGCPAESKCRLATPVAAGPAGSAESDTWHFDKIWLPGILLPIRFCVTGSKSVCVINDDFEESLRRAFASAWTDSKFELPVPSPATWLPIQGRIVHDFKLHYAKTVKPPLVPGATYAGALYIWSMAPHPCAAGAVGVGIYAQ